MKTFKLFLFFTIVTCSVQITAQVTEINGVFYRNPPKTYPTNQEFTEKPGMSKTNDYKSLPLIKPDFMVNSLEGNYGAEQTRPSIAVDSSGNYALTWIDTRDGKNEIFAQFFNSNDEKIGGNILVSEWMEDWNNTPAIAANKRGDFIIAWSPTSGYLQAQRFTKTGIKLGNNFSLNIVHQMNMSEPSVAISEDGSFMAFWSVPSSYDGVSQNYIRAFDSNGDPLSSDVNVNDPGMNISSSKAGNMIASDGKGGYGVVWSSYNSHSQSNIYFQKLGHYGEKIGSNVLISADYNGRNKYFPSISATEDGYFFTVWEVFDSPGYPNGIFGRIYHTDSYYVSGELTLYEANYAADGLVSSDGKDIFLIQYTGEKTFFQKIKKTGELAGEPMDFSINYTDSTSYSPESISNINFDKFYFSYVKYHYGDPNIFLQKYNIDFSVIGNTVKVNDDSYSSYQTNPFTHFNEQGRSIVLWEDRRNGSRDLYAQVYDSSFNVLGTNIKVNDISGTWPLDEKNVCALSDGTFIIAFERYDNDYKRYLTLQKVTASGEKAGNNVIVKEEYKTYPTYELSLNANSKDEILICWYNASAAYIVKYDKNLNNIIHEKNIISYSSNYTRAPLSISVGPELNVFATWSGFYVENDVTYYDYNIYGLIYDDKGKKISDTLIVNAQNGWHVYSIDNRIIDKNNYIILWSSGDGLKLYRTYLKDKPVFNTELIATNIYEYSDPRIIEFENQKGFITWNTSTYVLGYFFNDNRRQSGYYNIQPVTGYPYYIDEQYSTAIFNNKLLVAIESSQNGTGIDIWGNVKAVEDINFNPEMYFPRVNDDKLYENYPNPFNASTKIPYELLSFHKVKLTVYDILGRKVTTLVDKYQEKGVYEVSFDASGLSSGVYFYKLDAFKTIIKKMVVLK